MTQKRKISVRKILQVLLTVIVTTGCIMAMVSASRIEDSKIVKSTAVHISNGRKYHFIEEKEIVDLAINDRNVDLAHTPLSKLDLHSMEHVIMADPWVANAQVFVDNDNVLQLYVTQRIPVVRLFQQNGASYYMDTTMSIMPLSKDYVYYTTVVTNVPEIRNDSTGMVLRKDILSLARTIQADSFWTVQVSQLIVDSPGMYEFIPVLGNQRILLGDATGTKDKLNNLFVFYKKVLNRIGWDKYETLDLRFKDQVVASPSLPYKGPVDKASVTMNWINSIVQSEAHRDSLRGIATPKENTEGKEQKKIAQVKPAQVPAVNAVAAKAKKPDPKKTTKKNNKSTRNAKNNKAQKSKAKATDKKNAKNNSKQKTPKYVYPKKNN